MKTEEKTQIKATELRVGNYVTYVFDSPKSPNDEEIIIIGGVNGIHNTIVNEEDSIYSIYDLKPIPLTEKWLDKFGFNRNNDFVKGKINIYKDLNQEYHYAKLIDGNYHFVKKLKYVHEFQNLHFELKGKELELT